METPKSLPRCKHGNFPGRCGECQEESTWMRSKVQPLADEFWDNRGARDLVHLMARAYRMGWQDRGEVKR